MKEINITLSWSGLLPALLAILQEGSADGKELAKAELVRMARVADLYVQKASRTTKRQNRELPSRRDRIIQLLNEEKQPVSISDLSLRLNISASSFASILRDEKIVKKNQRGRVHIIRFEKEGISHLALSTWELVEYEEK